MANEKVSEDQFRVQVDAMAAVLCKIPEEDYSLMKDENGNTLGFWLKDPDFWLFDTDKKDMWKRLTRLRMIAIKHQLPEDIFLEIINRKYRIIPNTYDTKGGVYLMCWGVPAPGEKKAWWKFW